MKRFITFLMAAVMLASTLVFSSGAQGTLLFSDNFDDGFLPRNWITDKDSCHFEWDKFSGCIVGYDSAKVLQSNYNSKYDKRWAEFYGSIKFKVRDFDDLTPEDKERTHGISIWYRDLMESGYEGSGQEGAVYTFNLEFETGKIELKKDHSWTYYDENGNKAEQSTNVVLAEGVIDEKIQIGERSPWTELGIRVTKGKIECYFNQKLVLSAEADPEATKYGPFTLDTVDETVGTQKSAFLVFNHGNYLALDDFQVWSADYDFVNSVVYGDADGSGDLKLGDASLMLKHIAEWEDLTIDLTAADVNVDGTVNLTDVSTLLKVLADWEGIVLGPQA